MTEASKKDIHKTTPPGEAHIPGNFTPAVVSNTEFERIKADSVRIYAYANRVISMARALQERTDAGFALFDKQGCLLKLYSTEEFRSWCAARDIRKGSRWSAGSMGITAVSTGLETQQRGKTSGTAHENRRLWDVEISFVPLVLEQPTGECGTCMLLGGIALITPADHPLPESMMLCSSVAIDITLHIFMANELYGLYFQDPRGLLNIDINRMTGGSHISYHNEQLFRTLGIPFENLYYKKAETLFDPLPQNREFWDIINQRRKEEEKIIPLSVRGKQDSYAISTELYQQGPLNLGGIRFFISSVKALSNHVAQHIGNNAVYTFSRILGDSAAMRQCISQAKSIAQSDSNVMITGESGVGKDLFAQAIHNASRRQDKPFIVLNCAAYPRDLLASELFGYDSGAYTGAKKNGNLGKFELADTGTIFLDEIGDMPLDLQVILLRVIEQKRFMRIGSNVERSVDVKIISATNADLQAKVEKRTFRPDLYFRLCTLNLKLPPLRNREEDIIQLAEYFIASISARLQIAPKKVLTDETKEFMLHLAWQGNVRELQNVMERVVQLIPQAVITPQDLETCLDFNVPLESPKIKSVSAGPAAKAAPGAANFSREVILQALENNKYNRSLAAKELGISRRTFYRKLEENQITL